MLSLEPEVVVPGMDVPEMEAPEMDMVYFKSQPF
jgi:hypothetical protein